MIYPCSTNVDVLVLLSLHFKHFKFVIAIFSLIHGLFIFFKKKHVKLPNIWGGKEISVFFLLKFCNCFNIALQCKKNLLVILLAIYLALSVVFQGNTISELVFKHYT